MGFSILSRSKNRKNHNAEATITVAMETIKILKAFVPFAPAQAALDSLCSLLAVAQVRQMLDYSLALPNGRYVDVLGERGEYFQRF